jgi:hypothetical protein
MMRLLKRAPLEGLGIPAARYDVDKDGVNASLLGRFVNCREMARLHLLGWAPKRVSPGRIFGIIVHGVLDRIYSDIQSGEIETVPSNKRVRREIAKEEARFRKMNPRADAETLQVLEMNCLLAEAILPVYFKFWHKDIVNMDWVALEHSFKVPLTETHLIGRMDGNFRPFKGKKVIWLFETKNKSRLGEKGESNIVDIMPFELQTNLYLNAMVAMYKEMPGGLIMNIIRRPGFKGKKGESIEQLAGRIASDVKKRPDYYFMRLRMIVDKTDLRRTQVEHEALVRDFVRWAKGKGAHYRNSDHCENKYGTCEFLGVCARQDYRRLYQRHPRIRKEEDAV